MNGKTVSARKARAATRTGKKTASARAPMQAAPKPVTAKAPVKKSVALPPSSRKPAAVHRATAGRPGGKMHPEFDADVERDGDFGAARKHTGALHIEEDEDLDWLTEDDDPRKQIVEGDEEPDAHHDEW